MGVRGTLCALSGRVRSLYSFALLQSTATGVGANASNTFSTATGVFAQATGTSSTATGSSSVASNANSSAYRSGSTASGTSATALGYSSLASGDGSIAIGDASATGTNTIAIGTGAVASASVAMGTNAAASGGGTAIGDDSSAQGASGSSAFGNTAVANFTNATALGANATANVPPPEVLLVLLRTSLLALDHANKVNDYAVLRALGAPELQKFSPEQLGQLFAGLRTGNIDLSPVAVITPQVREPPQITPRGLLRLVGYFPTQPLQVQFEILFQPIDGRWRIFGLTVRAAAPGR